MFTRKVKGKGARTLGLILIAFILYGTTVEAAHRHGRILTSRSDVSSVANPNSGNSSSGTRSSCNDCLICQLHQHFSNGLISIKVTAEESVNQRIQWQSDPLLLCSISNAPATGRAPPLHN